MFYGDPITMAPLRRCAPLRVFYGSVCGRWIIYTYTDRQIIHLTIINRTWSSDFLLGSDFDLINYCVYKFLSWFVMIVLCCVVLYDFVHCLLLRRNNKYNMELLTVRAHNSDMPNGASVYNWMNCGWKRKWSGAHSTQSMWSANTYENALSHKALFTV